jgi:hypothetical protein
MKKGGPRHSDKKPYWKRNDFTSSKPILINQPGTSAVPSIEKLSHEELLKNKWLIKKSGGDIEMIR